jgi:NAD(P)-dependent dehydrogenase (short-subunit alcohol dehydrogenase family)
MLDAYSSEIYARWTCCSHHGVSSLYYRPSARLIGLFTSGGRGLGFNIAQALTEAGVRGIAIFDRLQKAGEEAAYELGESGIDVSFYKIDVTNEISIQSAVQDVIDHYGHIDILVNSAGIAE